MTFENIWWLFTVLFKKIHTAVGWITNGFSVITFTGEVFVNSRWVGDNLDTCTSGLNRRFCPISVKLSSGFVDMTFILSDWFSSWGIGEVAFLLIPFFIRFSWFSGMSTYKNQNIVENNYVLTRLNSNFILEANRS